MTGERFDIKTFLISLAAAVIWAVVGNVLYSLLEGKLWGPLLTGIFFAGLVLSMYVSILIANRIRKGAKYTEETSAKTLLTVAGIVVAAILLDFLYGLDTNVRVLREPSGYAFLIDDSGSMLGNDSRNVRASAIAEAMKGCDDDFPFVVYKFTDTAERLSDVIKASEASQQSYDFISYGNTDILGAIETVTKDLKDETVDLGKNPRIVLLSDGGGFYFGIHKDTQNTLDLLEEGGISLCTVGFGDSYDDLLARLANGADGVFVRADDASDLSKALREASTSESSYRRNLLEYRSSRDNSTLFMILRILFLIILGGLFILVRTFAIYTRDDNNKAFIVCVLLVVLGALTVELGLNTFFFPENPVRGVMCVCFAVLIGSKDRSGDERYATGYTAGRTGGAGTGFAGGESAKF